MGKNADKKIAFLGTGLMGFPMARNLCGAGLAVFAWNRSADKAQGLAEFGAQLPESVSEAVDGAEVIISMVSDGAVLNALIEGAVESIDSRAIWVDMSSTLPEEARAASERLAKIGAGFIDAPVSGGTLGAQNASLAIMAGGAEEHFNEVRPTLSHLGNPVRIGNTGAGQLAKLANQLIVASTIGAVAEAMLLLESGGADSAAVRKALKGGFADSTILQQHGARMQARDFTPGGLAHLQLKDLDNIASVAKQLNLTLPMTAQTHARFARYVNELDGAMNDHSGLFEELLSMNDER